MSGYTKLFSRILDSTIWREPNETRLLWITMLAMADQDGIVHCTIPGLADRARISLEQCEAALYKFQQPDKYSWSKEMEGRRITEVDGGWFLVNHAKYRALMCREEQQEKTRLRVQKYRELHGQASPTGHVYYAVDGDRVKIGFSTNPWSRVDEMRNSNPDIRLVAVEPGSLKDEKKRHYKFAAFRLAGEWFEYGDDIKAHVLTLGNAHVTPRNACNDKQKQKQIAEAKEINPSDDREEFVNNIAKLYPKIADYMNLSREYAHQILEALARHGYERVLQGTQIFRASFDRWPREKLAFAPSVASFFGNSQYLFDAGKWDAMGGITAKPPALPADISVGRKRAAEFGKTI